jgi:predicted N-acetyltransferase YhbS
MATGIDAEVRFRAMTPEDLPAAHMLSREQKWPHTVDDWAFFLKVGEGLVAERDGDLVGTTMGWRFGDGAATVGMVIVSPAVQGQGIGRDLMDMILDRMGGRTVMLNATKEGMPLYRKLGFEPMGGIVQHQGTASSVPIPELLPNERVRPMGANDTALIGQLYSRATGMDRTELSSALSKGAKGVVLARNDQPVGFALFRRFGLGYVIGPTVAPDVNGAKALISHWLGSKAGKFCRLDVPEDRGLSPWLDDLGLPGVGRVTRMARGPILSLDEDVHIFSLASQALG